MVFDYESAWAWSIEPQGQDFSYFELVFAFYRGLRRLGLSVDIIPPTPEAVADRKLVVAPGLFTARAELAEALARGGAAVLLGPRSGSKTPDFQIPGELPPGAFRSLVDVKVRRVESLRPGVTVPVEGAAGHLEGWREFLTLGEGAEARLRSTDGEIVLAHSARAFYLAGRPDDVLLETVLRRVLACAGLAALDLPRDIRVRDNGATRFVFNYGDTISGYFLDRWRRAALSWRKTPSSLRRRGLRGKHGLMHLKGTQMRIAEELVSKFKALFGAAPRLFRAPGRVNLIGEHTDYNDGFVMPAAIDLSTIAAIAPRDDRKLRVHSVAFERTIEFDLDDPSPTPRGDWSDYVRGVTLSLENAGHRLVGADLMLHGDLPMGAGLSASAALEVAVGFALCSVSGVAIDLTDLALYCQRAENEFVGMRCGVMDQFISCRAVAGCALLLDCRSLEARRLRDRPPRAAGDLQYDGPSRIGEQRV